MAVLHVDMDAFFASVEQNRNGWNGKPVVVCVYSGRSEDSGAVSTCSYEARELGIHAAMPIKEAKRIAADTDADVKFVAMDRDHYGEISDRIRDEVLEEYAEKVEQASIDEFYAELDSGFDDAWEISESIRGDVEEQFDLTCSIGVAENKLVAKIASDRDKPDGMTVVSPGEREEFMRSLELGDIHGIGDKTVQRLEDLGVGSVAELAEAETATLVREFGENLGVKLKRLARGEDESEVEESEQKQFTKIVTLEENTRSAAKIESLFPELAEKIVERARDKGFGFRTVSLVVVDSDIEMHTRSSSLNSPVQDQQAVVEKGEDLLEQFLQEFDGEVRRIGLRVSNLEDFEGQKSLGEF